MKLLPKKQKHHQLKVLLQMQRLANMKAVSSEKLMAQMSVSFQFAELTFQHRRMTDKISAL